jgi:DNA-directed RNA polymerase omega subunit
MARITTADCERVVPNRFELVLLAAARARALCRGARPRALEDGVTGLDDRHGGVTVPLGKALAPSHRRFARCLDSDRHAAAMAKGPRSVQRPGGTDHGFHSEVFFPRAIAASQATSDSVQTRLLPLMRQGCSRSSETCDTGCRLRGRRIRARRARVGQEAGRGRPGRAPRLARRSPGRWHMTRSAPRFGRRP